ncbi:MAG: tetratricopeptide repeat protein, partial [Pseudomonadota bacterium]
MDFENLLQSARGHLARKAYRQAHAACLEVLKRDPHSVEAFYLLGILTADHANHDKAVELFDRALANNRKHSGALAQKARSLIAL